MLKKKKILLKQAGWLLRFVLFSSFFCNLCCFFSLKVFLYLFVFFFFHFFIFLEENKVFMFFEILKMNFFFIWLNSRYFVFQNFKK